MLGVYRGVKVVATNLHKCHCRGELHRRARADAGSKGVVVDTLAIRCSALNTRAKAHHTEHISALNLHNHRNAKRGLLLA